MSVRSQDSETSTNAEAAEEVVLNDWRAYTWDNGDEYKGFWRDNQMHGRGSLRCGEGLYQGEFFEHQMHGFGRFDFSQGGTYIGQFDQGRREVIATSV